LNPASNDLGTETLVSGRVHGSSGFVEICQKNCNFQKPQDIGTEIEELDSI
jgi:hypothetical protein